jgi:hypothetical protein
MIIFFLFSPPLHANGEGGRGGEVSSDQQINGTEYKSQWFLDLTTM